LFRTYRERISAEISSSWASFAGHKVKQSLPQSKKAKNSALFFENIAPMNAARCRLLA
jgi:hypothetical protein